MPWRYQLADAVAGISYTFCATLAILYFMKILVYVYKHYFTSSRTTWWMAADFSENYLLEDTFGEAIRQQSWTLPTRLNSNSTHPVTPEPHQVASHTAPLAEEPATPIDAVAMNAHAI
jgi:hypothetical protein